MQTDADALLAFTPATEPSPRAPAFRSMPIERSTKATLVYSAIGLAASILAYVVPTVVDGALAFFVALPVALVAILFFVGAHHASWRAECPRCEWRLALPANHELVVRCPGCAHEVEARAGLLRLCADRAPRRDR